MFIHNLNPVLIPIGPLELRWYGLAYLLGFFFTVWYLQYQRKYDNLDLTKDEIWDFGFYLMLGLLIGARIFVVFWDPGAYLENPLEFFKIWHGGMSFHGALFGSIIAGAWFCKKKKVSILHVADLVAVPAIFGLALGRLANFMNAELVGLITDAAWCVDFSQNEYLRNTPEGCRHPWALYAALKRFTVFGWLYYLTFTKKFKEGFIFWNFIFWDGLGRFVLDYWRIETQFYFGLTPGQLLSLFMIIIALYFFWKNHKQDWKGLLITK